MGDVLKKMTVDTYNQSAQALADYFKSIGARTENINEAFALVGNPLEARVVEIGCGNGRDAAEIVKRTDQYHGFDISEKLIEIAKKTVPQADFVVADAVTYNFPEELNIIFAFASLLHVDKEEFRAILQRAHEALVVGGIFYISLKYADSYQEKIQEDKYGKRLFFFYNADIIAELAGESFEVAKT